MSKIMDGLFYSQDHDWVRLEDSKAYIGITDYAQESLGDIVFADGEPDGTRLEIGDALGVVESVKAASDIFSPLTGVILEVNRTVLSEPSLLNSDPYEHWLVCIECEDTGEADELMDAEGYAEYCASL